MRGLKRDCSACPLRYAAHARVHNGAWSAPVALRSCRIRIVWRARACADETAVIHIETLQTAPIDLLVCDEAHRLKNPKTKVLQRSMPPRARRALAAATPWAPTTIAQPPKLRDRDQMVSASRVGWRTVVGAGGIVADARACGLGGELPRGRD